MKIKLLFVATLLFSLSAKAQYFHSQFGTANDDHLSSGVNTLVQPQGHFIGGNSFDQPSGITSLLAIFADVNGTIPGAPYFSNKYDIVLSSGVTANINTAHAFELDNGAGFGLAGSYNDPSGGPGGVFYLQLDPNGNPVIMQEYAALPGPYVWNSYTVDAIAESISGNELYITGGAVVNPSGLTHVFAMKIDVNTGGIIWSHVYEIIHRAAISRAIGRAIIESPYASEVVIAGIHHDMVAGSTIDGFTFRVDPNTGAMPFPWAMSFGTNTSSDHFTSITLGSSGSGGNVGFVLGGMSTANGSNDNWLMKTDPTATSTLWSTLHDYSLNPGTGNHCFSVIERLNTFGNYEYYMGGTADQGFFGQQDVLVIKTDDNGNGVANGEFTYGTPDWEHCRHLDQYNGTGADGLSIFCDFTSFTTTIGFGDIGLIKSYFDGNSGCDEIFSNPLPSAGPGFMGEYQVKVHTSFSNNSFSTTPDPVSWEQFCYTPTIGGASNARIAPAQPQGDKQAIVSPNPMAQGTQAAIVELEAEGPARVEVAIYDMLGKQYYTGNFALAKGKNQLPVDISDARMAAGMYTVKVSGGTINKNILLLIK